MLYQVDFQIGDYDVNDRLQYVKDHSEDHKRSSRLLRIYLRLEPR
jgi:hypothetical protein